MTTSFPLGFLWPAMLWLLLMLPLLVWLYLRLMNGRKKLALHYTSLTLVREAMASGSQTRRHIPPVLALLALTVMLVATARPTARITMPTQQQTILLAVDVSGSMRATDVAPNRLVAAQNAAKAFLQGLPRDVKVGIVTFAGSAQVALVPTTDRDELASAIEHFQLQRGTAIGNGIVLSLAALLPGSGIDLAALTDKAPSKPFERPLVPLAPGSHTSAAIILLTDGQRTSGVDSLEAAQLAADRGVRVYTVGVGTANGDTIAYEGWSMRVQLDEEVLRNIALKTGAEYFYAGNAQDLKQVYQRLSSRLTAEKKETEITAVLALMAAVFSILASALSVAWFNRVL